MRNYDHLRRLTGLLSVPLVLLVLALAPTRAQAYTATKTVNFTTAGQNMIFAFSSLPPAAGNVSVKVDLYGDYNAWNEYAEIWVDNTKQSNHSGGGSSACLSTPQTRTYTVAASYVSDTTLTVRVDNSSGVGATCTTNRAVVTVSYSSQPDLQVTASTVPYSGSTAGPGSTFRGRYTIRNATTGVYFSTNFAVRYYYCPAASATGCTYLTSQTITNNFSSGESHTFNSPTLTMPSSATAGTRYIRAFVDGNANVTESNETNNNDYDAITVTGVGTPDLQVTSSTVPHSGSTAGPGSTFTARYNITAANAAVTTNFSVRFYYCPYNNQTWGCVTLSTQSITSNFTAGQTQTFTSQTLTMPSSATNGTRYIRIRVDPDNNVTESNESNNNRWDAITVAAKSDLSFTASTVPYAGSTAGPGHTFNGRYTIRNATTGASFSTNFTVRYYYCTSASTSACTFLTSQNIYNNFSPGESYTFTSSTLTMPASATAGTRYIRAWVDGNNNISETNENNNNDYDAITVTGAGTVDLTVNASTAPYTGSTAGANTPFTVRYRVRNAGPGTVTNAFYTYFYYCTSQSSYSCTLLGSQNISTNIGAAKEVWFTSGSLVLPNSATRGTRYIRIYVDATNTVSETSGSNNYRYNAISVTTRPDLSFSSGTVPYTGDTSGPGSTFTGRYTVINGAKTTYFSTNFYVRYYYCTSSTTSSCTQLASQYHNNNFDAGKSYTFNSPTLTLPSSATKGTRYIRAFVDATGSVTESNENNNNHFSTVAVGSTLPDLMADNTTVPYTGSTAGAGSTFSARYRVRNGGKGATTVGFTTAFFYCPSASTTGCISLGYQAVSSKLAGGQTTYVNSPTLKMPAQARYGTGYVRIAVDSTKVIAEANENNNNVWDSISVTNRPDLYFTSSSVPYSGSTAKAGSTFTGRYTIVNGATTSAFATNFTVSYHYCPAVATSGCVLMGSQTITADFNAGSSYTYTSATLTLPSAATSGNRYVRAQVDSANAVTEYNENNNTDYDGISVGATNADLYVKTFTAKASGTTVTFTATVCNSGGGSSAPAVLGLYYHLNLPPGCSSATSQVYTVGALNSGACASRTFTRTNTPKGAYVAWARADAGCKVSESDETNNNAMAGYTVSQVMVDSGPPPDSQPAQDSQPTQDLPPGQDLPPPLDMQPGQDLPQPPDMYTGEGQPPQPDIFTGEGQPPQPDAFTGEGQPPQPDIFTGDGLPPQQDGKPPLSDTGPAVNDGTASGDLGEDVSDRGCNCTVGQDDPLPGVWLLLLGALAVLIRRRRK